jgi:TetR/AcrR family transcriptional repressor of uid operon
MSPLSKLDSSPKARGDVERLTRIVEAAQRAFVRLGFHAATMSQVAEEAGMSAGNLYRYFASKEALVEGLCLYDHNERAASFLALASRSNLIDALAAMLNEHVVHAPREKARLICEIWAEAGRNPRVAEITRNFDRAGLEGLSALLASAKARGGAAATLNADFVARSMITVVAGLFKRLAVEDDFDREREARYAIAILKGLFSGAIAPETPAAPTETK